MTVRIGIDTGGTFTDFVLLDRGEIRVHKVRSTPHDPSQAIVSGLRELVGANGSLDVVHGSTVATNAVLERKGGRIALVTTRGFEDVLFIGRQTRRELYNVFVTAPAPIVEPGHVFGLSERMLYDGSVLRPLDLAEVDDLVAQLHALEITTVAVCLLHAYANSSHEHAVAQRLTAAGFEVSASHTILSEYREFERCSTTALNAYVTPLMASYLGRLARALGGNCLTIMQSNGGTISADVARRAAVRTVLSGPAGGVVGAAHVARAGGFERVIAFDMGGTSTDVSLIDRAPGLTMESIVGDCPVRLPMLDIHTVGAGGGSIAYVDAGGSLRVGPESAGADPGPACYGRGRLMTVTDANVLLGRIDPDRFLGGRMEIIRERSAEAAAALARQAGLDPLTLAEGIVAIANANMERAIRVVSVERGHDPRDFALVGFGGAGGLHACDLAVRLDIQTILMPIHPGVLSALGMLLSDAVSDFSQTVLRPLDAVEPALLERSFQTLEADARIQLAEQGFSVAHQRLERSIELRYMGQAYEIAVAVGGELTGRRGRFCEDFHASHERLYGYADPSRPLELVNIRVRSRGLTDKPALGRSETDRRGPAKAIAWRPLYTSGGELQVPVFDRTTLGPGDDFAGPALAVDEGSTTFVTAGWRGHVDGMGNLILTTNQSTAGGPGNERSAAKG